MSAQPRAAAAPTLELEVDPARVAVKITVDLPAPLETLSIWRAAIATGHVAFVRGWVEHDVAGAGELLVYDWEAPLGIELAYYAQGVDADGATSELGEAGPITVDDSRDWLVDLARPTNSFPVLVESLPDFAYEGPTGVHRIIDRRDPVLTSALLWTPSATLTFVTATELERDQARALLGAGYAFLLRTPPEEGVGNIYLGPLSVHEQRASRLALHPDRRFAVDVVQVARPDPTLFVPLPPLSYRERLQTWPTYAEATATGETYQELAYTFPSSGPGSTDPSPPWLPDDV